MSSAETSNKVAVLHWHVEALLDERVSHINVGARAEHWCRAPCVVEALHTFLLESLFCTVKNYCHLLVPSLLVKSPWSCGKTCAVGSCVVLAWSWNFELQTLPEEDLVEVEPWWWSVEPYLFACCLFVVRCSCLVEPLRVRVGRNAQTGNLIFDAQFFLVLEHHLLIASLSDNLPPRDRVRS